MEKYRTEHGILDKIPLPSISTIEYEKETEFYFWHKGKRISKKTACVTYHDSWSEAKHFFKEGAEKNLRDAVEKLERAKDLVDSVSALNN